MLSQLNIVSPVAAIIYYPYSCRQSFSNLIHYFPSVSSAIIMASDRIRPEVQRIITTMNNIQIRDVDITPMLTHFRAFSDSLTKGLKATDVLVGNTEEEEHFRSMSKSLVLICATRPACVNVSSSLEYGLSQFRHRPWERRRWW